jgi:hypothetical protein
LNQHPIIASIAYLDASAKILELGVWRIHIIWCTWRYLNLRKELTLTIEMWTTDMFSGLFPGMPQHCILLRRASLSPGTPQIASSFTEFFFVALFSHYSTKLLTIFTHIYFCLHSPTWLHHHQHGAYCQPHDESLFTDESRSPPWESTYTCIEDDCELPLQINSLHFQPSIQV